MFVLLPFLRIFFQFVRSEETKLFIINYVEEKSNDSYIQSNHSSNLQVVCKYHL